MSTRLSFLGAAGTVTGSRFLLEVKDHRYLIDCGLFQGGRSEKVLNWEAFPIPPERIDAVLLTHAHIDHVGYLPRLLRQGFRGPVYATDATQALLEIVLPDSAHLQEQDALYANKKGYSRHKPALPLYTAADAEEALKLIRGVSFDSPLKLDGVTITWRPAGHILGSATLDVEITNGGGTRRVVFSGDLGRYESEVMRPPVSLADADVLLVESTYGDRLHSEEPIQKVLGEALDHIIKSGGVLLIPAFAVGRTQEVLYHLRQLQESGRVPDLPIFVDSPMAVDVSHIYCRFGNDHNLDINLLMDQNECPLRCRDTRFVRDVEESKQLNTRAGPAVIISASGMVNGGRIMHHLKWRLPDKRNALLFVGYQAEGTKGRLLLEGAERIRIHGEEVPVRAHIFQAHALSAHADRDEILRWLGGFSRPPRRTFVVHGEPKSSQALQEHIRKRFGWEVSAPRTGEVHEIV
ncbi:MAG: MBL fold metallo-hydrolase [Chloroflexi bacterium]|nr:MBL fold metallo-hydrolase [Chloroflexota bacterium]MBI3338646.1 MBL fold metallo-hydrolase [Chloroflexota bacterium]